MTNIFNVPPDKLIKRTAEELEKIDSIKPPEWSIYVKTGVHKERPPAQPGWWFVRSAAILRSVYKLGPIGVSKLRTKYGGRKNLGHRKDHFRKGSGSIVRKILQQLEAAGFLEKQDKGKHKGRTLTPKGKSFIDKIAVQIAKELPKPERPKPAPVKPKKEPKKPEDQKKGQETKVAEEKAEEKKPKKKQASEKKEEEKLEKQPGNEKRQQDQQDGRD
ncbi:30S ribosomal protein S19e [Candidatus Woesearchaeota archaeon]|nr:30S ribosomal protein S19e [Candidatus Woesearchaeota archaeon]